MPSLSAIQLDRLLDSGGYTASAPVKAKEVLQDSIPSRNNNNPCLPRPNPHLYATPSPTPLPLSPTPSYDASPFLLNHKRRGPPLSISYMPPLDNHQCLIPELVTTLETDGGTDIDDFFESTSYSSLVVDADDYAADSSINTPLPEFFDASEELSFDSGKQPAQRSLCEAETELGETRLSLLMEIEKRKQVEETVKTMRLKWEALTDALRAAGVNLPSDLEALAEGRQSDVAPTEEICRQIHVARFVSESIGRGFAKAEAEAEMEAQLEMKNFEIARLCDRLHYYETMNREMSQRNQEAVEIARCERLKRSRRQKWVWGSIATALTFGTAALAWSYLPSGEGSSSTKFSEAYEPDADV